VLINGPEERTIPGNALSVHPELPFRGLERFGVSFLSRFEGSQMPSSVLRSVTLVDTPGVLSGEKQRTNRGYDFTKVVAWFAEVSQSVLYCSFMPSEKKRDEDLTSVPFLFLCSELI
jgi:EH domain-containing protein 1